MNSSTGRNDNGDNKDRFLKIFQDYLLSKNHLSVRDKKMYQLKCLQIFDELQKMDLISVNYDLIKNDEFMIEFVSQIYKKNKNKFSNEILYQNKICVKCFKKTHGTNPLCIRCLENEELLIQSLSQCQICEKFNLINDGSICADCINNSERNCNKCSNKLSNEETILCEICKRESIYTGECVICNSKLDLDTNECHNCDNKYLE